MIVYYLIQATIVIGNAFTYVFGRADLLPFGTDSAFVTAWGWVRYLVLYSVWPLQQLLTVFILYLGWRIGVKVVQVVFGSRAPVS